MANTAPVIDAVNITYPAGQTALAPGQQATITVVAHDPDAVDNPLTVTVTDGQGATATANLNLKKADPLTYKVTAPSGVITQGSAPNVFVFTA